ncbi:hypothetical protein [Halobacillus yeomjeoni]|uniref:Uncharacterized protein n=1 Tax=Halobacillus yeomjeoni TaxID=311194 RepID=A0A931MVX0_9BACI|nr:hypothetical protein [Halobacillus yeomjeoni]MBH0230864.1 hypothetical protein [Halobacillus yeomjeoni]
MAQLSRLFLDMEELSVFGRYSVRIDQTIVIEPKRQLTETTFRRIQETKPVIHHISIKDAEVKPFLEFKGPYRFKKVNGVLVFERVAS